MKRALITVVAIVFLPHDAAAQAPTIPIVSVPSADAVMFGALFSGIGSGPRPTVVLLTGHPGTMVYSLAESRNVLQLAEPIREAGFNVLAINFRGSWGSGGRYGLIARLDDVHAALSFARTHASSYGVNTERLSVVGWSMGGFNALVAGVEDPGLACTVAITPANYGARRIERLRQETAEPPTLDDPVVGLGGFTGRDQRREVLANQPRLEVASRMEGFRGRPLLIVQAEQDETVPADDVRPYVEAARAAGAAPFDHVLIDTNHNFTLNNSRPRLASEVVNWLTRHCS